MIGISLPMLLLYFGLAHATDNEKSTPTENPPEVTCDCPRYACDACSFEQGVTFYSGKCGPQGVRIRSCSRPTCVPISAATDECPVPPAPGSAPRDPIVVRPASSPSVIDANDDTRIVGNVKVMRGSVSIVHADGKKNTVEGETKLRETDTVEASNDGAALIKFDGGNKLHVHPDTVVQVKEYKDAQEPSSRRALLQLIKGKIRNQVEQKYNGKTSYYKVYTAGAVAGVRGTDFVMEHHEGKRLETKAETLSGRVTLATLDEKQANEILQGQGGIFAADLPDASFSGTDYTSFIQKGKLSPVYKIGKEQMRDLDLHSRVDIVASASGLRTPKIKEADKDSNICQGPSGHFNQCMWKCIGNPTREKSTCRIEQPNVSCRRYRCDGNGKWSDETNLQGDAAKGLCPATGAVVKDCDY